VSETTIPNLYLPPEIMTDDRLTLRQIRVLMAIFSWRKTNTSLARISRQMIADRTGYRLSRVSNITTELEKLGWIKKTGNGGKSQWTEYQVKELKNFKKTKTSNGTQNGNGTQFGYGTQKRHLTVPNSGTQTVPNSGRGIDTGVKTGKVQVKVKSKLTLEFWANYPKKVKKKQALRIFEKLSKTDKQLAIDDCKSRFTDTESQFIPHPTTYLNGELWNDEPEQAQASQWGSMT